MARDQFLESCSRELYVHLKPKTFKNLDEMAKKADLFAEARGGVHTLTNKGQRDNSGMAQNHIKPDVNKAGRKQEIKCGICGKGHLTIKCYKNPNRMQATSAEVENEAKGCDSDAKMKCKGHRLGLIVTRIKGTAIVMVAVEIFPVDEVGEKSITWWRASSEFYQNANWRKVRKQD